MQCKNHPDVMAVDRCAGCAESFCSNCLVNLHGQNYCGSCKILAISGQPMVEAATMPCKLANEALTYAIVGLLCCVILQPFAIVKAVQAKGMMAKNPRLTGSGKATAALTIAIIGLVLWVLGVIARVASLSQMGQM